MSSEAGAEGRSGPASSARAQLVLLVAGVAVIAALAGNAVVSRERARLTEVWRRDLDAKATDRADVARLWFHERRADADVLADSPLTQRALASGERPQAEALADLQLALERMRIAYGYVEISVVSAAGRSVASAPAVALPEPARGVALAVMRSGQPQVALIDGGAHLAFGAPVRGEGGGAVVLEMDARWTLHARLADAPATMTGETLLVHARGGDVVFVSPRRHGSDRERSLSLGPERQHDLVAAVAARGEARAGEFRDYRGHAVLAATRGAGLADFGIVTKIDRDEALAPLGPFARTAYSVSALAVLAFAAFGSALLLRLRSRKLSAEVTRQRQELERRQVEVQNARLGRALDESNDEVYVVDGGTLRILEANARAREATRYDAAALTELGLDAIEPEMARADIASQLEALRDEKREVAGYGTVHRRADGTTYPVEVRLYRAEAGPDSVVIVIATDASARRELEAQLVQAQKMEAVGRLAGGIAHDFNNLLTLMLIASDGLRQHAELSTELRSDAEEIYQASTRAADLTRQLLMFSRKQVLRREVVDANEVVRGLLNLLERAVREDIELELSLADGAAWIATDRSQLEQSLLNLVVNARDAMPAGGRLSIQTAICLANEAPAGASPTPERWIVVRVCDTGEGMSRDTARRIFEPFFTTKPLGRGTGLGLAMVYSFVTQSGGAVQVQSDLGQGTTFELFFPESPPAVTTPPAPLPAVMPARGETILLVDDSTEVRRTAARVLRAQGYTVLEAADGVDALRIYEEQADRIALVLTDVVMPKMGGRALGAALRSRSPSLPLVFMSGYADDEALRAELDASRERFLPKPFTPERLAQTVRAALDAPVG